MASCGVGMGYQRPPTVQLRIDAMTFGWVEDKDGVRQNVLTSLGVAWILGSDWDHIGIILGSYRDHIGIILGSWGHGLLPLNLDDSKDKNESCPGTRECKGIHRHTKAYRASL